jgi:hypothetical protein
MELVCTMTTTIISERSSGEKRMISLNLRNGKFRDLYTSLLNDIKIKIQTDRPRCLDHSATSLAMVLFTMFREAGKSAF